MPLSFSLPLLPCSLPTRTNHPAEQTVTVRALSVLEHLSTPPFHIVHFQDPEGVPRMPCNGVPVQQGSSDTKWKLALAISKPTHVISGPSDLETPFLFPAWDEAEISLALSKIIWHGNHCDGL